MRFERLVLILTFLLLCFASVGCTMESPTVEDEISQPVTLYIPVINQLPIKSVRALTPPEGRNTEVDWYGTMFLPQLTHFTQTTSTDISSESFPIYIFGETVFGEFESGPKSNQYTLKYQIGDDEGYIEVTVDDSGSFDYKQYLLVDVGGDAGISYMIHTIDSGQISENGTTGEYVERGQLYYGFLDEDEAGTSTSILPYQIGSAKTYIRGNENLVYGIVDPVLIDMDSLNEEDLYIADKPQRDITVSDLVQKLEVIKSFNYARNPSMIYPMNDLYYFFDEDRYDGYFSYGGIESDSTSYPSLDTRDKEIFEDYTGHSFEELGFPECENIFQFLGDSLMVDYYLIGDGDNLNWVESGDRTVAEFTVAESSTYMVTPGFNILDSNKNLLGSDDLVGNEGGEILELSTNTTYYISFLTSKFSLDEMSIYSYLFQLE